MEIDWYAVFNIYAISTRFDLVKWSIFPQMSLQIIANKYIEQQCFYHIWYLIEMCTLFQSGGHFSFIWIDFNFVCLNLIQFPSKKNIITDKI